jgi:hypothetical protein
MPRLIARRFGRILGFLAVLGLWAALIHVYLQPRIDDACMWYILGADRAVPFPKFMRYYARPLDECILVSVTLLLSSLPIALCCAL